MGYHNTLIKSELPKNQRSIACGVILQGMGKWLPGYNRRNPEIEVSLISNLSNVYRSPSPRGWRRWFQHLRIF